MPLKRPVSHSKRFKFKPHTKARLGSCLRSGLQKE
ncbi:hypothetical protein CPT_Slocum_012 [Serratia phage Slocum]|nr:hypothetical protein CPT_Slocum_012 [Serratia phage Slocum]